MTKQLPHAKEITITLLVMGAVQHSETFYSKAAAKIYFGKYHHSVCCYPLVAVNGKQIASMTAARRYFGIKEDRVIPWA